MPIPFGVNTDPQVFAHLGHAVAGYLHTVAGNSISQRLASTSPKLSSFTLTPVSAAKSLDMEGFN